ncbi:hypothetical protein [Rhizobium sophoriradicis]|uniref:hypothetical protein n=1 Tax=Rhizobium sophoriradicis TaxID=1535245 RepID=UPI0015CCE215|nr:hypothetical protein [Rhizobium sophoriradicis]
MDVLHADTPMIPGGLAEKAGSPQGQGRELAAANWADDEAWPLLLPQIPNRVTFNTLFDAMLTEKRIEKDWVFWTTLAY